ncbi:MAG: heavy metal translocating P-type ATPase, partial [Victivallales bacterium]|nr:heavy metal translocating P-type ATPase [Victivallales bacterium]
MADAIAIAEQNQAGHEHCCDHDHDHKQPGHIHAKGTTCPVCGNVSEGVGHDRSMGRLSSALIGGFFVINSFLLQWLFPGQVFSANLSAIIGAVILALPIIITAVKDLIHGKVYMNELVALAILSAFAGRDFQTAGIIAFFLLLTIIIESRTASGAQRSIEELVKLTPHTASKIVDGAEIEVDVLDLAINDIIRVRPGDNFPVDGVLVRGETTVNQASITGESLPVDKEEGGEVFAGTQNLTGSVEIRVTRLGEDTTLGKVKDMIMAAESSRTPIVRIIDRYAGFYTPMVLMLAALTWWISDGDMRRVITLMVITCPCAIVLATPTAVVAAVAAAARLGIFIKNVAHLESASKIRTFVFDKTGTLTDGVLSVARLAPIAGVEPAELLLYAASAEIHSNHPTAKALQRLAGEAGLKLKEAKDFQEEHGKGVITEIDGEKFYLGRFKWLSSMDIDVSNVHTGKKESESYGMSVIYVARGRKAIGWIGFKDKIRNEADEMIKSLKVLGVERCAMVTG